MKRYKHHVDEERYLAQIRNLVQQHKLLLEQQMSIWGPLGGAHHLAGDIAYFDQHIAQLDSCIAMIQRRKRRRELWHRVLHIAMMIRQHMPAIILALLVVIVALVLFVFSRHTGPSDSITGNTKLVATAVLPSPIRVQGQVKTGISGSTMPVKERRMIANTGGIGVRFRQEPYQDALSEVILIDGKVVSLLEQVVDTNGGVWWHVETDDGAQGYIKEEYLAPIE